MKSLFDQVSTECSKITTRKYSNSFSLAVYSLGPKLRAPIYAIYGFVRLADEIVDSFHDYNRRELLEKFRRDTREAIRDRISLNPILNSFQQVVHTYGVRQEWIDRFMESMEMDLGLITYDQNKYRQYIHGSAEVVGLMCLHVFTGGNQAQFDKLMPAAMKLGAAFQKVNFLRDLKADYEVLQRTYFPQVNLSAFTEQDKKQIEEEIESDFQVALKGIRELPPAAQKGVYLAYCYYYVLFQKIKKASPQRILRERIRIPDAQKILLLIKSNLTHQLRVWQA